MGWVKISKSCIFLYSEPWRRKLLSELKIQIMYDISPGIVVIYEPRVNTNGGGIVLKEWLTFQRDNGIGSCRLEQNSKRNHVIERILNWIRTTFKTNPDAESALTVNGQGWICSQVGTGCILQVKGKWQIRYLNASNPAQYHVSNTPSQCKGHQVRQPK